MDMTSDLMSKIKDSSIRSLLTPLASNVAANWLDSKSSVAGHSEMECGCALRPRRIVHACVNSASNSSWEDDSVR